MTVGKRRRIAFSLATGGLLLVGLLLLLLGAPPTARADPGRRFVVPGGEGDCSQADPCHLQAALGIANHGDAIYLAQGTYTGTGAAVISLTKDITLYGGWDGVATGMPHRNPVAYPSRLDGQSARRVVYISGPISPVLAGLVISGGNAEGLGGYGTSDAGGGIFADGADPLIAGCTIIGNSAGPASTSAESTGGGIFLIDSDAQLQDNRIISNTARWGGGARLISGAPVLRHNRFFSNTSLFGGGIYLMYTSGSVEENAFQGNTGDRGGAIYLSQAGSAIKRNLLRGNKGEFGGGIGINGGSSPLIVSGNRILGNEAAVAGGGVRLQGNDTHLENNFIAHNEALSGAGIHLEGASPVLRHNTLASNTSVDGVGVFVGEDVDVHLTNTILVSHTVGINVTTGSTATLEATLWYGNGSDTGGGGTTYIGAVNVWDNPAFVDSAAWDYHLLAGSSATDAGVDAGITSDIDGDKRPQGSGYDIGADEYAVPYLIHLPLVRR